MRLTLKKNIFILVSAALFFYSSVCISAEYPNLLKARYSTTYASSKELYFDNWEKLVSHLKNPTTKERNEFETISQYQERIAKIDEQQKSFSIHFKPVLGKYTHEKKSFPVRFEIYDGVKRWDSGANAVWHGNWSYMDTSNEESWYLYKDLGNFLYTTNMWKWNKGNLRFRFGDQSTRWLGGNIEIQTTRGMFFKVENISDAEKLRENQDKLKARLDCVYIDSERDSILRKPKKTRGEISFIIHTVSIMGWLKIFE